jgi:hypothetical protein
LRYHMGLIKEILSRKKLRGKEVAAQLATEDF